LAGYGRLSRHSIFVTLVHAGHVHLVVTPEEVMTHRDYVVKSAGGCKENNHEQKRINNASVMLVHRLIDSVHRLASF